MQLEERFAWRGREVAWGRSGSGPALVFCHGTPWSSVVWEPFADALAGEFTVYLWDMPGYGRSSKHAEHAVDLGVQGELLAELFQYWQLDAPHVVAHDYGGAVSLRARLLHGAAYSSLCLVDVVALRPWGSPFFTLVKEHAEVLTQLPPAVHRGALEAYVAGASHRGLRDSALRQLTEPWVTGDGQSAFYRQIAQADEALTAEAEPLLGELAVPTHIVWGTEDTWIPVDRAERLRQAIPGSTVSLIPEAGHLIQYDAPVALASDLHGWLTERAYVASGVADR
ncbi:MAG: alpha/beta fold hydrolase [Streptosporangiales bacterium]